MALIKFMIMNHHDLQIALTYQASHIDSKRKPSDISIRGFPLRCSFLSYYYFCFIYFIYLCSNTILLIG